MQAITKNFIVPTPYGDMVLINYQSPKDGLEYYQARFSGILTLGENQKYKISITCIMDKGNSNDWRVLRFDNSPAPCVFNVDFEKAQDDATVTPIENASVYCVAHLLGVAFVGVYDELQKMTQAQNGIAWALADSRKSGLQLYGHE